MHPVQCGNRHKQMMMAVYVEFNAHRSPKPVSTLNTIHHSRLNVCLPPCLSGSDPLPIDFCFRQVPFCGRSRNFDFTITITIHSYSSREQSPGNMAGGDFRTPIRITEYRLFLSDKRADRKVYMAGEDKVALLAGQTRM